MLQNAEATIDNKLIVHYLKTSCYCKYMPPFMTNMALTLTSLPGVHNVLCY